MTFYVIMIYQSMICFLMWQKLASRAPLYRKWYRKAIFLSHRKCKISLSGPWQKVDPIPLTDVTILPCLAQCSLEQVPVWAISEKGDVLCRLGVTANNPAVSAKPRPYPRHTLTKQGHLFTNISFHLKRWTQEIIFSYLNESP